MDKGFLYFFKHIVSSPDYPLHFVKKKLIKNAYALLGLALIKAMRRHVSWEYDFIHLLVIKYPHMK